VIIRNRKELIGNVLDDTEMVPSDIGNVPVKVKFQVLLINVFSI
jgi:hypothetical protein